MSLSRLASALLLGAIFVLTSSLRAQPADELIDKLLALSKESNKRKFAKDDDEIRQLLIQRYNVAVDELRLRCEDFKKQIATKTMVFEAGKHLLQAELELQRKPAEKVKVLEQSLDLVRWYEKRMATAVDDDLAPRADLLRIQYTRLTLEIDLAKLIKSLPESKAK